MIRTVCARDLMAWVYLIAAGLFEVGWPIGLKWAQDPRKLIVGGVMAVGCLIVSGVLLYLAQREIALGTAYAVWTGSARREHFCSAFGRSATRAASVAILRSPSSSPGWSGSSSPIRAEDRSDQTRAASVLSSGASIRYHATYRAGRNTSVSTVPTMMPPIMA
jgi:multidrug transporter EmrE-like cation transporter